MSDTEIERLAPDERPLLARSFDAVEVQADGRNIEMLCAPFDTPATVMDPPTFQPYQEEFARGAFTGAVKAPNRTLLEFEHFHPGLSGVLGHGAHFEEQDSGLYGRFRVGRNVDGDKALELIHEGVLTAASVFFAPIKTAKVARDHVRRLQVQLDRVALCRVGAYPQAKVLAVRQAPDPIEVEVVEVEIPDHLKPREFDPELAKRLTAAGVELPAHLKPIP